ncbi:MAG: hypothetical protein SO114_04650 [Candidatus Cryptobacteroides sp.]|nr:hypothetical protein [Candidatus Cryptobacteroides sp.]
MKLINKIFALALAFASIISCTQTLAPMAEPQDFSEETARLNNNVAAAQALAQGQVINSVNVSGSVYNILLANGTQLRIDNKVRSNAPYVEFKDGEWLVDETVLTDAQGDKVALEFLPEFAVNAEGKWTVSAAGKETVLKSATADVESGYFAGIEHTETTFSVTTRSASVLSVPVAAGFLFKIDATGVQSFVLGQTRSYTVTRNGISAATVVAPEGWEVKLSEAQISVTSPHSPVTKSVVADSKTDVSVIAVSTAGYVTIAKIVTDLDETASATDPFATLAMGEIKAYSAKANVTLQNQTAWYWMLKKSSETAPSAEEIKAANTGSDTALTLATEPETDYTLYVLPVGETKEGAISKISFTTTAVTSYYEAWEAGAEIKIGSQTYSKAKNGKATLVKNADQRIWGGWFNDGTFGAVFLDEGASAFIQASEGYNKSVVVIGNVPGTRPVVKINGAFAVGGSDFILKNVSIEMANGIGSNAAISSNTAMGRLILDDCRVDMRYPMLKRFDDKGTGVGKMTGVEIIDCDVCVNWASDNIAFEKPAPFFINTHAGGADCGDLIVRNNVFWSKDDKQEFHICAGPWVKDTKFNDVVLENNTFYNVNCGELLTVSRQRALIVTSTLNSFSFSGNIAYDTDPDSKTVSTRAHFVWLNSTQMKLDALQKATTVSTQNLIDIAEYCSLLTTNANGGADWGNGLINLITWQTGSNNQIIDSWKNPFAVENVENGYFVTTDEYKAYGAQRK